MFGNELANEENVCVRDHPLPVTPLGLHVRQASRSRGGTQGLSADFFILFLAASFFINQPRALHG
jgi:hypothetical protein